MRLVRARRITATAVIAGVVALYAAPSALALSCVEMEGNERARLRQADAAIVGRVVEVHAVPGLLTLLMDDEASFDDAIFTIRVERVHKGDVPRMIDVIGPSQYPIPSVDSTGTAGWFLQRVDGLYYTSPCSELDARTLGRVAGDGNKPSSGAVVVRRLELLDPVRSAVAGGIVLGAIALAGYILRTMRFRRGTNKMSRRR